MKYFFRALFLAVLGVGAFFGGLFWAVSLNATDGLFLASDGLFLAFNLFLLVLAMLFGVTCLFQARDDWTQHEKTGKTQRHALQGALVLLIAIVLLVAGYAYWQGLQPVTLNLTYVNGTTGQNIAHGVLTLGSGFGNAMTSDDRVVRTDAQGQATVTLPRGQGYNVFYGEGITRQSSFEYIDTYGTPPTAITIFWQPPQNPDN
ncbi:hypothetical protein HY572_03150 [Candidatus Micrarchaeota archaeon]|nr:hypothetical protein [Candidatus Micrarchaeota archaeon]